jgi:CheY-like chemotaxis protein
MMESATKLIEAISTWLWPAIFLTFLMVFRAPLKEVIASARSRRFSVEIAGQKLSMEEVSEQQRNLIADLQAQIAEIRKAIDAPPQDDMQPEADIQNEAVAAARPPLLSSVLWVDDTPKNNSFFVEELQKLSVRVDLAETTSDGLALFRAGHYGAVISDIGHLLAPRAGLDLLQAVREIDRQVPFFIFCSARGARIHREEALRLGVTGITSSPTELYAMLNLDQLRKQR